MKHVFIVNKISGKGLGYSLVDKINTYCHNNNLDYDLRITERPGHARELASQYNSDDITLYAVGGDGTLSEVLNGMNLNCNLAVIPAGSGNDFFRNIKEGGKFDFDEILDKTIKAPIKLIDLGIAKDFRFINNASVGVDASIGYEASYYLRNSFLGPKSSYTYSILKNVLEFKSYNMKVFVDDEVIEDRFHCISIFNGQYYGNDHRGAPDAVLDDGLFDVVLIKKDNRLRVYGALGKYLNGKMTENRFFSRRRAKKISFISDEDIVIQRDGEGYRDNHLEIMMVPKAIKLKFPIL